MTIIHSIPKTMQIITIQCIENDEDIKTFSSEPGMQKFVSLALGAKELNLINVQSFKILLTITARHFTNFLLDT